MAPLTTDQESGPAGVTLSPDPIRPERPPDPLEAFSLLVEHATEYAVFTLSPDGLVSTWNEGAARIKGYDAGNVIGRHVSIFYSLEDSRAGLPEQHLRDAVANGRVFAEGWRLRQDGTRFWASAVITPLLDHQGRLRGFAKLTRDETDRREAERLLAEMGRLSEAERIASNLGGTVIYRLGSVGLHLSAASEVTTEPEVRQRIQAAIAETDMAIQELRRIVLDSQKQ